jgi:hypothetical protein
MDIEEDMLLAEVQTTQDVSPTEQPVEVEGSAAENQPEEGSSGTLPGRQSEAAIVKVNNGCLTKTQKKNMKRRQKKRLEAQAAALTSRNSSVSAAGKAGTGRVVGDGKAGNSSSVTTPLNKKVHVAWPMPKSVYMQAWAELVRAKRAVGDAMELLKFYRYDHM